ncbi:MAG: DUF3418 domain-containing protein, partial [Rhodoferax sp.]|nr:DUF3418 domain-containing protein [Rhodoferax sp.]
ADQAHAKFDDEKSEFSGYLKLWKWIGAARGDKAEVSGAHKLSNRQFEQLLRQNFISVRRLREWKDIHSQLLTVVAEHQWRINTAPASYEQLHLSMLAGLLGNVGCKLEAEGQQGEYLGARSIKFFPHPGAHLVKKPGRWIIAAELVETTRLFGRGIAAIDPQWVEQVGGHLLKKQLLDPHWEKKAAEVVALERATLYGMVVYSGRRVNYSRVDMAGAREIFIRQALVEGVWETALPFLAANLKLIQQVEDLEHKARRQDVLVDDALIYAFYDQQLPADVCSGYSCERWYREEVKKQPALLMLTREELMRHEAAGITSSQFPKTVRLGGVDCAAAYLHEPGDARDGVTVSVPLFVLNQVNEERCEWLVPGMLKDKVQALLKTLHQRPRSRLVPLPETAARMAQVLNAPERFGAGGLVDALLKLVREATALDIVRADIKVDMLPAHFFMNIRVIDEHGRQLGQGRNLGALKAQWGSQARGAFQALAALKLSDTVPAPVPKVQLPLQPVPVQGGKPQARVDAARPQPSAASPARSAAGAQVISGEQRYSAWTFGELPELLEIRKGAHAVIGFPALVDAGDAVTLEVFDEPQIAASKHRSGLARLFALQLKDAIKYLEKNIPDLQKMGAAYMQVGKVDGSNAAGGTVEELKAQIIALALERAFLLDPLPTHAAAFQKRLDEGRGRLTLIANEVARMALTILLEYQNAARKIKDSKNAAPACEDASAQVQRLVPKRFLQTTPWPRLQHLARYLQAVTLRLDKYRADPARDAARLAELRPLEQRYWRLVAERKGAVDERMAEFRWLMEELRVSLFAQELRTPQPVSVKRLEKAWAQLDS